MSRKKVPHLAYAYSNEAVHDVIRRLMCGDYDFESTVVRLLSKAI